MAICCVSLILALLDKQIDPADKSVRTSVFKWLQGQLGFCLTGQVVAAYGSSRERIYAFPTRDFGSPRRRDFARLNLHLTLFEQPGKKEK